MHAVISVTGAGCQSVKITSERQHDGPVFKVGRWVRDRLLMFDLGYFRYQLFSCITRNGGYFISRLKANANPRIVAVHRIHRGGSIPLVGMHLRDILDRMQCEILDVMVEVSFPRRVYAGRVHRDTQRLRVVGIRNNTTAIYHLYITNVPVEILCAEDVGAVYAARWEIELLFKELKGQYRIEDLPSRKRPIVEALIYAAILTLIVSRRLLDLVRRKLRGLQHRFPERRWAAVFVSVAHDLLTLMVRPPRQTTLIARMLCELLLHEALDPHLDRPSLIHAVEMRRHHCHLATA
jgi:IS4 transposase